MRVAWTIGRDDESGRVTRLRSEGAAQRGLHFVDPGADATVGMTATRVGTTASGAGTRETCRPHRRLHGCRWQDRRARASRRRLTWRACSSARRHAKRHHGGDALQGTRCPKPFPPRSARSTPSGRGGNGDYHHSARRRWRASSCSTNTNRRREPLFEDVDPVAPTLFFEFHRQRATSPNRRRRCRRLRRTRRTRVRVGDAARKDRERSGRRDIRWAASRCARAPAPERPIVRADLAFAVRLPGRRRTASARLSGSARRPRRRRALHLICVSIRTAPRDRGSAAPQQTRFSRRLQWAAVRRARRRVRQDEIPRTAHGPAPGVMRTIKRPGGQPDESEIDGGRNATRDSARP